MGEEEKKGDKIGPKTDVTGALVKSVIFRPSKVERGGGAKLGGWDVHNKKGMF